MRDALSAAFQVEWDSAEAARRAGDFALAFSHLERAHILAQRSTWRHVRVHAAMFRSGWARRDWREVAGQSSRMLAAALFSRIWVPLGNTGGANVSAFRPMALPPDLQEVLNTKPPIG